MFWGVFALGRLVAIPLAMKYDPKTILAGDLVTWSVSITHTTCCYDRVMWSISITHTTCCYDLVAWSVSITHTRPFLATGSVPITRSCPPLPLSLESHTLHNSSPLCDIMTHCPPCF